MNYENQANVTRVVRRLVRLAEALKGAEGTALRMKAKHFQNVAIALARAYRKAGRLDPDKPTQYRQAYKRHHAAAMVDHILTMR